MTSTEFLAQTLNLYPSPPQEHVGNALDYYTLDDYAQDLTQNECTLDDCIASVSTTFYIGAHTAQTDRDVDTIFLSSDSVIFYVHSHVILEISKTAFESFLSAPLSHPKFRGEVILIPETSHILDIILHILYGISPAAHGPTLDTITTALTHMPRYGMSPKAHITSAHPMHDLLLSFAPQAPLELYTLAGQFDLHDLAVPASAYVLPYPLTALADGMAMRMGAVYLKRLFALYLDRARTLKDIVLAPPLPHPASAACGFDEQQRLARAWALVSAYLAWECRPGLTSHGLQAVYAPLADKLTCDLCKKNLHARLQDVVSRWVSVRRTI